MANVKYFALTVAAVFIYTGCARDALASNDNALHPPKRLRRPDRKRLPL